MSGNFVSKYFSFVELVLFLHKNIANIYLTMMNPNTFTKEIQSNFVKNQSVINYAQTNIQLFNQLRLNNYSETDLRYMCNIYELAMQLFASRLRGSGKPFLSHLVGTASILATLQAPRNVTAAGLLHAAYIYGEYGTDERGITEYKREQIRQVVGSETEQLIADYTNFTWNQYTIPTIRTRLNTLNHHARQVLLIRLANELEDHLDLGVLYCGNAQHRREYIISSLFMSVEIAQKLGFPSLATDLECAFQECLLGEIPPVNCGQRNSSFLIHSKSVTSKTSLKVIQKSLKNC
jgi:(p)ppGpp synthase/HD superfamily hydrolase